MEAASNFYPIDSVLFVENSKKNVQIAIFNEVCESGSAYLSSRLEIIINRRTFKDDGLGMAEPLKEVLSFNTKYFLSITSSMQ